MIIRFSPVFLKAQLPRPGGISTFPFLGVGLKFLRPAHFNSQNMLFLTQSAAVYGIDALIVDIEVNLQPVKGEVDTTPTY